MSKAALITGGGKRLGKAISLSLAERGYDIAIHYNHSDKEAKETADLIREKGRECEIFQSNLSDISQVRSLIPTVFEVFPQCSILVNSASIFENIGFNDVTEEIFERDFNTNFKAPFFLSQDFSKGDDAELIINMLDMRINKIETEHFTYNLTKKALRDFTLMAAKALGPKIRVNGICPGPILPPPDKDIKYLEQIAKNTPLEKPGNPDYIITAVKYLLDNSFVTGQCLFVDGGQHLI
ncbi:MAG: SDR family oxidoreductase [Candidatus Dadabacteria bacterium]|nr:SDR family oxidoreductase [Candidatus Dadabacteria bacterium]MCH8014881.1 SDR family oxidoreductase [Candidatus Dadabacteria bacterium]